MRVLLQNGGVDAPPRCFADTLILQDVPHHRMHSSCRFTEDYNSINLTSLIAYF